VFLFSGRFIASTAKNCNGEKEKIKNVLLCFFTLLFLIGYMMMMMLSDPWNFTRF